MRLVAELFSSAARTGMDNNVATAAAKTIDSRAPGAIALRIPKRWLFIVPPPHAIHECPRRNSPEVALLIEAHLFQPDQTSYDYIYLLQIQGPLGCCPVSTPHFRDKTIAMTPEAGIRLRRY